jgi:hypothetical protein
LVATIVAETKNIELMEFAASIAVFCNDNVSNIFEGKLAFILTLN